MNRLLLFTLCVFLFCSCSNKSNNTESNTESNDFTDLIEQCNKDIKSGGFSYYYTGAVNVESDTLFLSMEAKEAKYSAKMVQIKNDELAKQQTTQLLLTCFYYTQFDENWFPYKAIISKAIEKEMFIGIKYLSPEGSWSNTITSKEMQGYTGYNEDQINENRQKASDYNLL